VHFLRLFQLVSPGPLSHNTLPSIVQNLQKHIWSPNLVISACTLQLPHKKNPLHPGPLPDEQPISSTMVTLFVVFHNCTYVTEYYYHYSSALSYFLEEFIICYLLFLLILCYSYQAYITSNLHQIEIFCWFTHNTSHTICLYIHHLSAYEIWYLQT